MTTKTHFKEKELLGSGFTKAKRKSDGKTVILDSTKSPKPGVWEIDPEFEMPGKYWQFIGRESIDGFELDV